MIDGLTQSNPTLALAIEGTGGDEVCAPVRVATLRRVAGMPVTPDSDIEDDGVQDSQCREIPRPSAANEIEDDERIRGAKAFLRPFQARLWAWFQEQPDFHSIEMGELGDGTVRFNATIRGTCDDCISFRLTNEQD
jgi:hypothetical protein